MSRRRPRPLPQRPQVSQLVARLNARWSTTAALQAFADDLNDETADVLVMHLLRKAELRGSGLAAALEDLAKSYATSEARGRALLLAAGLASLAAVGCEALASVAVEAGDLNAPWKGPGAMGTEWLSSDLSVGRAFLDACAAERPDVTVHHADCAHMVPFLEPDLCATLIREGAGLLPEGK